MLTNKRVFAYLLCIMPLDDIRALRSKYHLGGMLNANEEMPRLGYTRTDTEVKRKAIENAYPELINSDLPDWNKDQELLSWLSDLK